MKKKPTLKEWLKIKKLTHEAFAEMLGVKRQYVTQILNEQENLSVESAIKVWEAANCEPAFFSIAPRLKKIWPTIQRIQKEDL